MFRAITRPLTKAYTHARRALFLRSLRRRLKNRDFTLVTNNCLAGLIYHQLGLPFLSPTINMGMSPQEYMAFAKEMRYYLDCEVKDVSGEYRHPFPVGRIIPKDEQHRPIELMFVHYHSFEEAVAKWKTRARRVNYDNLVFIYCQCGAPNLDMYREFETLPGKKMLILQEDMPGSGLEHYCYIPSYDFEKKVSHLFDREDLSGRRIFNRFDFVSFLNGNYTGPRDLGPMPPFSWSPSDTPSPWS